MSELARWTLFSLLDPAFASGIRFAVVFGSAGNEALIVTDDDKVYGMGTNACSCLGIGNVQSSLEPTPIDTLCGRQVTSIAFGSGPHVIALTLSGEVFSWGHNGYGQLGCGNTNPGISPMQVTASISGCTIQQVACGNHHTMALSDTGELYAWGQNTSGQLGIANNVNQSLPKKVTCLVGKFIKSVACGQNNTVALADNGEVFSWGFNGNGQLGLGNTANQHTPQRVHELQGVVICQVACGFAHCLVLSDEGMLFAWGSNSCGQLGTASRANQLIPVHTAAHLGRIIEIGAIHACNVSAAQTADNQVYMWGQPLLQVRGQSISRLQATRFGNIDDVFACFATPPVSWRPVVFEKRDVSAVQENIRAAFDDPNTADVVFQLEAGHKTIHAHRALLKIRCQHFRSMFHDMWKEGNGSVVEIEQFPYSVYRAFLQYLYTDQVDLPPEDAIGLLDLANCYCEGELKEKCADLIRRGITVDNCLLLYAAAIRYDAHELREYCFQFSLNHMTACTQSEAFARLDDPTVKAFISQASRHGAFKN